MLQQNQGDIALEDLIKTPECHFQPPPIIIAERFHFHKRDQRGGESIADFVARFICGMNNEKTVDLTILKAIEIATNLESAERNTHLIKSSKPGVSVEANIKAINTQPCYCCGRKTSSL